TQKLFEKKYLLDLYESYGLSETLIISTNCPSAKKQGSVGILLEGASVSFASDGEILVHVPWMFQGYLNVGNSTALLNGWFSSGDVGTQKEGFIYVTERKKDLIIRGGINISPKLIKDRLLTSGFF